MSKKWDGQWVEGITRGIRCGEGSELSTRGRVLGWICPLYRKKSNFPFEMVRFVAFLVVGLLTVRCNFTLPTAGWSLTSLFGTNVAISESETITRLTASLNCRSIPANGRTATLESVWASSKLRGLPIAISQ